MLPREHYLKQSFQDPIHFPDGFEKGGLSDIQARLVRKNGVLINALSIDEVSDPTTEDLHLLKVIANQSSPKNPVEQAWVKYLSLVKSLAISNPKSKGKAKVTKPAVEAKLAPEPEPIKAAVEKPAKIAEKVEVLKANSKEVGGKAPAKKADVAPAPKVEPKAKAAPAKTPVAAPAKKEKAAPAAKAPVKAAAKKPEPKKVAPKELPKKVEVKKADVKKPAPKKVEAKKPEPKKAEPKKAAPQKAEVKKAAPKAAPKKAPAKKSK